MTWIFKGSVWVTNGASPLHQCYRAPVMFYPEQRSRLKGDRHGKIIITHCDAFLLPKAFECHFKAGCHTQTQTSGKAHVNAGRGNKRRLISLWCYPKGSHYV